jgi:DNA-binding beta-propeller fold protein YncE
LIGMTEDHRVILLEPKSKKININSDLIKDAFPAHIYSDPRSNRDWFMNDGDKETGNDTLNCGDKGSSVTVVENTGSDRAKWLKTLCVGRGHHQAAFAFPSPSVPQVPQRVYISNLKDGTISVIGNDPGDAASYLQVVATVNLCEPEREEGGSGMTVPNNAFPHGLAYSPITGKLYNLNNGYGTVAIIDPLSNAIEERVAFKGHSNLFASPDGRYLIGRGADRKSDPHHVIGKLSVLDVATKSVVARLDLPDIYFSKYYFNPEGTKLYLTTASSGSPEQQKNLKTDVLLVLDMTALPDLKLLKEVKVGTSGALAFYGENGRTRRVFSSQSETGSLVVLDADQDKVVETIAITAGQPHSRIWMLSL